MLKLSSIGISTNFTIFFLLCVQCVNADNALENLALITFLFCSSFFLLFYLVSFWFLSFFFPASMSFKPSCECIKRNEFS